MRLIFIKLNKVVHCNKLIFKNKVMFTPFYFLNIFLIYVRKCVFFLEFLPNCIIFLREKILISLRFIFIRPVHHKSLPAEEVFGILCFLVFLKIYMRPPCTHCNADLAFGKQCVEGCSSILMLMAHGHYHGPRLNLCKNRMR